MKSHKQPMREPTPNDGRTTLQPRTLQSPVVWIVLAATLAAALFLATPARADAACRPPPTPAHDLNITRYYIDKAGTKIDPELKRRHRQEVATLKRFVSEVTRTADYARKNNSPHRANCALAWMRTWAKAGAYLGNMGSKQAEHQRKWDLAGVALAYSKLRPFASDNARAAIEPWLKTWADKTRTFFDNPGRKRNNHWYWMGLAQGAVALATESPKHWKIARGVYEDAMRDIQPNGTLPFELKRGRRALHYHTFATTALVALAELAAANGENWYGGDGEKLHRLVNLISTGLTNPKLFAAKTGAGKQEPSIEPGAGWLQLYTARYPRRLQPPFPATRPRHRWLGGDVQVLKKALAHHNQTSPAIPTGPATQEIIPARER